MVSGLVSRERARLRLAIAVRGVAIALAIAAAIIAVSTVALGDARWITRPSAPAVAWIIVTLASALTLRWTGRESRRATSRWRVAAAIERERALRAGSLRGVLEVDPSGALGRRAADRLVTRLEEAGGVLAPALQRRAWKLGIAAGAAAILSFVSLATAREAAPDGWRALRHPVRAWTGDLLPQLVIVDPPDVVMRGERLSLRIAASDRKRLVLHTRATGAAWRSETLPVEGGTAMATLGPIDAELTLVASDGRASSDTVVIRVTDKAFIGDVAIRATYPSYLGRAPEALPVGEPLRVPRGTILGLRGRASTGLESVALVSGTDTVRLTAEGHRFSGRMTAPRSGEWVWMARGATGEIPDLPPALEIEMVADSIPRVLIVAPATDTVIAADDRLTLRAEASDDHGLATIVLRSWRQPAGGQALPDVTQPLATPPPGEPRWNGSAVLDLGVRALEPGDELHVRVIATDNSPWRQTAASRELVLRVPTLSERRELARALADTAAARAASTAKSQRQLERKTGEAARSRGKRGETTENGSKSRSANEQAQALDFQSAEEAAALAKEQQKLAEQIRSLQQDARSLEQQLRAAGALDSSLARQLREAQAMLRDALTPELAAQLDQLVKASQRLSGDEVRNALENLARQQQRLREQLERSAEMLKRAALEGAMQTLRDEARELATRDRAAADSFARGDSMAAHRGRQLADRAGKLSEDVDRLAERMAKARAETGPPKLRSAAESARNSSESMRAAAKAEAAKGDRAKREEQSDAANEAARHMEQAAEQLSAARDGQIQEWKNELTGELDRSIQEMLQMAREEQALAERAREGTDQNGLRADQSALQQGVEKVGERLDKASQRSTHVSPQAQGAVADARRRVEQATQQATESQRGGADAAQAMQDAAQALNRAAAALVKDREGVNKAGSASGFSEMLQRMREAAKEQGALNAQSASLLPVPGGKPGAQASAQARALANKQRGLANRLDQAGMGENPGRAAELAKEMRQIADALESARIDPGLLERQQRLFRRLLDAGLSLEKDERDDKGERESRSATGDDALISAGEARGRSGVRYREPEWGELRGLTVEERRAVLEYFKRINAERP